MNNGIIKSVKIHFDLSFEMLEKMIAQCPDELWDKKLSGFVFWQQILHALTGIDYWMRQAGDEFTEPFEDRRTYPELDHDPEGSITRDELIEYKDKVKTLTCKFFESRNDAWMGEPNVIYDKIKNIDIVFMLTRHVQYHVGHCDSILRDRGFEAVEWVDYFG
ncbi:MAG TPA: DinB family protein [Clostridia bacterium]|nr:DinB family protein [Clostridia bacterium]